MDQDGIADAGEEPVPPGDVLAEFGRWLGRQRGLAPVTVDNYCWNAGRFLAALPRSAGLSIGVFDAGMVTAFMVEFCRDRNTNSAKSMARSVRSFLRFAHATGRISLDLRGAVPASSGWHLAALPKAVAAVDLERLLTVAASARFAATGRRDYAILLLLARLGLRRGEVAALRLGDIDWRAGELAVTGKGDRVERLPLPVDVGEALAGWLTDGWPGCSTRSVFTTIQRPVRSLSPGAIGHIVATACRMAGLPLIGAHRLRHSLATEMLRAGASLPEVGQVLRHRSPRSTAIYAKVDQVALRPLARPWPGAAPVESGSGPAVSCLVRPWPGARS